MQKELFSAEYRAQWSMRTLEYSTNIIYPVGQWSMVWSDLVLCGGFRVSIKIDRLFDISIIHASKYRSID